MKLWLSMVVKNEANTIPKFFWKIYDLFDDIVVIDTWSTDDTVSILRGLWINPISYEFHHSDQRLTGARNLSIEKNRADRVLVLDWDEFITREDIVKIKKLDLSTRPDVQWCFIKRIDCRYSEPFEDYKMCLINKNYVRFLFNVHACPQVYIRDNWLVGIRLNGITLYHYPEHKVYRKKYTLQLQNGILENPWCLRFYRFLWYYYFKNWYIKKAKQNLEFVVNNINKRFPVESLNACMVLSSIYQKEWNNMSSYLCITNWLDFINQVKNDFELKINFRLYPWFIKTHDELLSNPSGDIVPYEFAF